jgi:hypothetical protein
LLDIKGVIRQRIAPFFLRNQIAHTVSAVGRFFAVLLTILIQSYTKRKIKEILHANTFL